MPSLPDFSPLKEMNQAVHDRELRAALDRALILTNRKRETVLEELPDQEDARREASEIKSHTIDNLAYYLEQFEANLVRSGVQVHWAENHEEANLLITRISREAKVKTAVLSKSMLGEEIGLEQSLKSSGLSVLQTDLGERILQLAGDRPSHITAPCLHLSAASIGKLFARHLGIPFTADPEELSHAAAEDLRQSFLVADMGITGVNIGVAGTGTLIIVENEGNVRMGTTLPRVLVSIMGIEKLVPNIYSAARILNLLGRNATGQRLPGYISLLGPDWQGQDGQQERHVILVDNGRSRIHADKVFRPLLWCIRCGACMNSCPVYGRVGGHAYGHTYPGPIGACLAPLLDPGPSTDVLPLASTLCGSCGEVCPVKIPLPAILLHHRALAVEEKRRGQGREKLAFKLWRWAMGGRIRYGLSLFFHKLGERLFPGFIQKIAARLGWHSGRRRPLPPKKSFRQLWTGPVKKG